MLIKNGTIFVDGAFIKSDMKVSDGVITEIAENISEKNEEVLDCSGKRIVPGMVDVHTHGCIGYDFTISSQEEIQEMLDFYAKIGTTSVLATVMTGPKDVLEGAMTRISAWAQKEGTSCKIEGIHMEGPFFASAKKGAHDEHCLLNPDIEFFKELQSLCNGIIRLVAIDPDLEGSEEFIKEFKDQLTISLGHSACNYDTAMRAFGWGASHVTHLFNAMLPMNHREPGLIGAFSDAEAQAEIICDGFHIHPSAIRLMFDANPGKMMLISDTISAMGLPDGDYLSGGLDVKVVNGEARLESGTIAGATKSLYQGVQNAIAFGIQPEVAILSATERPAKSVGIESKCGKIQVGRKADFLIVDNEYNLELVYVSGNLV